MKKVLFIALTALLFLSCEKSNIDVSPNYVGYWENVNGNVTHSLDIGSDGQCYYEETTRTGNVVKYFNFEGQFILHGSELKIGLVSLTVDKEPTMTNNVWTMTLENIEYTKN